MDPIPPLTEERLTVSQAVAESFLRTNLMANSVAARKVVHKPAPISRLDSPVTISIDSDLMPGLIDMFGASGQQDFETWLGGFITDALRPQLGL